MASQAVTDGVDIENQNVSRTDKLINRCQFYQALVDSLNCRLMPASGQTLIECVNVLFPLPGLRIYRLNTGNRSFSKRAFTFWFHTVANLKDEYRDFKDCKGVAVNGPVLRKLLCAISTLPVSTAECERGFSRMNLICSPLRSCLSVVHMSSLLFISTVGPPLEEWKPLDYVKSWLAKGRHASTDLGKPRTKQGSEVAEGRKRRKAMWKCV